jgi:hypothetical protein
MTEYVKYPEWLFFVYRLFAFTYLNDANTDHEVGRSYPEARLPGWQWVSGRWSGRDFIVTLFFIRGRDDDRRFRRIG